MKRIIAIILSMIIMIIAASPLSVHATAIAPTAQGYDLSFLLMDFLFTSLMGNGCYEYYGNYQQEKDLYQAFMQTLAPSSSMTAVKLDDGTYCYMMQGEGKLEFVNADGSAVDGSSALDFPDEETWSNYRLLTGGGGDPDPDNDKKFYFVPGNSGDIATRIITGIGLDEQLLKSIDSFSDDVAQGKYIDKGIAASSAKVAEDFNYYMKFKFNESVISNYSSSEYGYFYTSQYPLFMIIGSESNNTGMYLYSVYDSSSESSNQNIYFRTGGKFIYSTVKKSTGLCSTSTSDINELFYALPSKSLASAIDNNVVKYGDVNTLITNIPIFTDREEAQAYYEEYFPQEQLDLDGNPLDSLADKLIDPTSAAGLATRVNLQLQPLVDPALNPNPVPDPTAFPAIVGGTVPSIAPAIDPAPNLDPEPEQNPEVPAEVNKYAFDLTAFFPFCLPFDLIHLLDALDAEPVAPKFEIPISFPAIGYEDALVIDLSFMDNAVAVFRICMIISFILVLIFATSKLIKW